jgi:hypothetical protein
MHKRSLHKAEIRAAGSAARGEAQPAQIQPMEHPMKTTDRSTADVIYDEDFIVIYRALDPALCRSVIDRFDGDAGKWRGKILGPGNEASPQEDIKSSWDLEILPEGPWRDVFDEIHAQIETCLSHYLVRSPILKSCDLQITGYKIQMYPKSQGYFRWHADSTGKSTRGRVAAMVLYLNDVEKGGETEFFHQGIKISPRAGNLVLFPAGWNYLHCGHTPESDDKYIIQTFVKLKD